MLTEGGGGMPASELSAQMERDRKDLERYREALSHIRWTKDCGIDGTNEAGEFVNFAEAERDAMYKLACDALQGWVPAAARTSVTSPDTRINPDFPVKSLGDS